MITADVSFSSGPQLLIQTKWASGSTRGRSFSEPGGQPVSTESGRTFTNIKRTPVILRLLRFLRGKSVSYSL
jgi:hypothetical protein